MTSALPSPAAQHISIRPLHKVDIRSRTVSGRSSISAGGQHLLDGVAFGSARLRNSPNQSVITPRDAQSLVQRAVEGGNDEEKDDDDDDDEDSDFMPHKSPQSEDSDSVSDGGDNLHIEPNKAPRENHRKSVRFEEKPSTKELVRVLPSDEDESNESDEDFECTTESASSSGIESSDAPSSRESSTLSSSSDSSSDRTASAASDSEADETANGTRRQPRPSIQPQIARAGARNGCRPGQGSSATRARNQRRRDKQALKGLIGQGVLPSQSTRGDLNKWRERKAATDGALAVPTFAAEPSSGGGNSGARTNARREQANKTSNKRAASALEPDEAIEGVSQSQSIAPAAALVATGSGSGAAPSAEVNEPPSKRARLELSSADRSREEEQAAAAGTGSHVQSEAGAELEDVDAWKSRVNLTAFECWNEDVELSAPNFPFNQHWDQSGRSLNNKSTTKTSKNQPSGPPAANNGALPDSSQSLILDYDGDGQGAQMGNGEAEDAVQSQLQEEWTVFSSENDLPMHPEDLSELECLDPGQVKVGTLVVFRRFECSAETNWSPEVSRVRTAVIEDMDEDGRVGLRLAQRDQPKKKPVQLNEKGQRLFEKFEVDEPENDDVEYLAFEELIEPKILPWQAGDLAAKENGEQME